MNKRLLSWRLRIGRLTGKPGFCLTTLGFWSTEPDHGAAYALLPCDADGDDHRSEGHSAPQAARLLVSAPTIPSTVREAFRVAPESTAALNNQTQEAPCQKHTVPVP
jgi:hypothetical protein